MEELLKVVLFICLFVLILYGISMCIVRINIEFDISVFRFNHGFSYVNWCFVCFVRKFERENNHSFKYYGPFLFEVTTIQNVWKDVFFCFTTLKLLSKRGFAFNHL